MMLSADDRPKSSNFVKNCQNLKSHCHTWILHEKCIEMSTNKPSIGAVVLVIVP